MSLSIQWLTLGAMLLSGVGMGVIFDGYRVVSNELRFPRWSLSILDLLYWIASALLVFKMLYASNNGEVRAYVFFGLAVGALLYYLFFSKLTMVITLWLIKAVKWCIQIIISVFHLLVVKPIVIIWIILVFIVTVLYRFAIGMGKFMLQLLRPLVKLVLWIISPITKPIQKWLYPYWEKWEIIIRARKYWTSMIEKIQSWLRRK